MSEKQIHIPVLLSETIEGLAIKPDGIYVDCTTGFAGHSREIAKRLDGGRLIGFDRDPDAVKAAEEVLKPYNHILINKQFSFFSESLAEIGVEKVDGVLMDLGVSSPESKQTNPLMRPPIAPTVVPTSMLIACAHATPAAVIPQLTPAVIMVVPARIAVSINSCFHAAIGKWSTTLGYVPVVIICADASLL